MLLSVLSIALAFAGCHREPAGRRGAGPGKPDPQRAPATRLATPPAPSEDPEQRWLEAAFATAASVLVVELPEERPDGLSQATVLEQLRGYRIPRRLHLDGLQQRSATAPHTRWLIAAETSEGWTPQGLVLAALPDSAANRRRVEGWLTAPWLVSPIVALVHVGAPDAKGFYVHYEVERVLAGDAHGPRWLDHEWKTDLLRPLTPGPQRYLLSAWGIITNTGDPLPRVNAIALTPVDAAQLASIEQALAARPRAAYDARLGAAATALAQAHLMWRFHAALGVGDGEAIPNPPRFMNSLDGYRVEVKRWLRQPVGDVRLAVSNMDTQGGRKLVAVSGLGIEVELPWSATEEARVLSWMAAPTPRFAAQPVDAAVFDPATPPPASAPAALPGFEPRLPLAALSTVGWLRFEVVRRRDVTLPGGQRWSWIHCRALADQGPGGSPVQLPAEEWMFAGVDLPTWLPGRQLVGPSVSVGGDRVMGPSGARLFFPGFFPGDDQHRLDVLLRQLEWLREPS
ncbi:MAG: hypothetical protein IT370_02625 [Deltaproteobacteria bacterium]|nr:hypothetical protein [Deltaproteobacteria bacterium]